MTLNARQRIFARLSHLANHSLSQNAKTNQSILHKTQVVQYDHTILCLIKNQTDFYYPAHIKFFI